MFDVFCCQPGISASSVLINTEMHGWASPTMRKRQTGCTGLDRTEATVRVPITLSLHVSCVPAGVVVVNIGRCAAHSRVLNHGCAVP